MIRSPLVAQARLVGNHFANGQKELRHHNQPIVAAEVTLVITHIFLALVLALLISKLLRI
jgi:hypothetical protein